MKLSELKNILKTQSEVNFVLPNGEQIPRHFHVTEVGQIEKRFIDCGGTLRNESVINFQLWTAEDYDHRLGAEKLFNIITLSEDKLGIGDHEIEVEYQADTIGKYALAFENDTFILQPTFTDCLAQDKCGIPEKKPRIRITANGPSCEPGSGCC